jgi:hypothetical protein
LLIPDRETPVAEFVTVTAAFGITAPLLSETKP